MERYYDGKTLLNKKDLDGEKPEIFICTTNRSAGKSVYFGKKMVDEFLEKKEKFILLFRYKYEIKNCEEKFFPELERLFYEGKIMTSREKQKGAYAELYLDGISCGYGVALNSAEQIKKVSSKLADTKKILFDEFQSENENYCDQEIKKFISIHTSIARGGGSRRRYLPVYLVGNLISLTNPYYLSLGVSERLEKDTKFLRGKGWVLEQGWNEEASYEQIESKFMQAFNEEKYTKTNTKEKCYTNDLVGDIKKDVKLKTCITGFVNKNKKFFLWRTSDGKYNISRKGNGNMKKLYAVEMEDICEENPIAPIYIKGLIKKLVDNGLLSYQDQEVKKITIQILKNRL